MCPSVGVMLMSVPHSIFQSILEYIMRSDFRKVFFYYAIFSISLILPISGCALRDRHPLEVYTAASIEHQKDLREETLSKIPDWFQEPTPYTPQGVSGKGTAISTDLQAAIDHATLNAQANLASELNSLISEQIKRLRITISSSTDIQEMISTTSDRYIPETNVSGARIIKQHIVAEGNTFRAYVLLYLNKPIHELRSTARSSLYRAHQELLTRNEEYRRKMESEDEIRLGKEAVLNTP